MRLLVQQADKEDIFEDLVRLHKSHRPGILAGSICRVTVDDRAILAVARNSTDNIPGIISLDEALRSRLKVKNGGQYDFSIEAASFWSQVKWGWSATNPVNRVATRLAVLSVSLGILGLVLGLLSVYLSLG